jgi:hypothetical protein
VERGDSERVLDGDITGFLEAALAQKVTAEDKSEGGHSELARD